MTRDDARRILTKLASAYPQTKLDEPVAVLFINEVEQLADAEVADVAVTNLIRSEQWFPSISILRSYYSEAKRSVKVSTPKDEWLGPEPIPTWVHVWHWARHTQGELRDWPQYEPKSTAPDCMTEEEYLEWEQRWRDAGGPSVTVSDVFAELARAR